jgi:hypothetical protein
MIWAQIYFGDGFVVCKSFSKYFGSVISYLGIIESKRLHALVHALYWIDNNTLFILTHIDFVLIYLTNYAYVKVHSFHEFGHFIV